MKFLLNNLLYLFIYKIQHDDEPWWYILLPKETSYKSRRQGKTKKQINASFFEMFHGRPYLEEAVCDSQASNHNNTSPFLK